MTQIPLGLSLPPRFGREDFLRSPSNEAAFDAVERWPDWPDRVLLLVGPPGCGKTHLSHIWAERAKARAIRPQDLDADLRDIAAVPGCLDGADTMAPAEASFFHLLNLVRQLGGSLLITARHPPDLWHVQTPDLLSRLRLAPMIGILPPDEALVRSVLVKLFDDRQIRVDATLIDYLTLRLDRSLDMARIVVEALDATGLSRGRRITRAMAAEILKTLDLDAE